MTTMDTDLLIQPVAEQPITLGIVVDALTMVGYSAIIVMEALVRRGADSDDAEADAVSRTCAYFRTEPHVVRATVQALRFNHPCDLPTLATACHQRGAREAFALGREWLSHRGRRNTLTYPFLH